MGTILRPRPVWAISALKWHSLRPPIERLTSTGVICTSTVQVLELCVWGGKVTGFRQHKNTPDQSLYKLIVHYNKLHYSSVSFVQVHTYIVPLVLVVCTSWLQKIHAILSPMNIETKKSLKNKNNNIIFILGNLTA